MSLPPHVPHTQVDLNKEVQSIIEGDILTDPTLYGVTPTDPNFLAVGPDGGMIEITYSPEILKRKKPGSLIRSGTSVLKKSWKAKLVFKASDNNLALQKWCKNKSLKADTDTPAASRTFFKSFDSFETDETYTIFRGCVPEKTNYTISKSGEIIYTVDLDCKTYEQNILANGGFSGTPVFASPDSAAPWQTQDGGSGAFTHNSKKYGIESFSVDIIRQWAIQDPSEALENVMVAESDYVPSGTITIQRSDNEISDDALDTIPRTMSLVLKSSTLTDTWTGTIFEGHTGLNHDGTNPVGLTDTETFSATDFVSA